MIENILSVDVEEWFHPEALQHKFPPEKWHEQQSRVNQNVDLLLELFKQKKVSATFFTLGWVAKQNPEMIKKIVSDGHEIASHGSMHKMITKMSTQEFANDLDESIKILQDISGEKVLGFRAPTFSVIKKTRWSWDIMLKNGLVYDSSVYPIWHDRYGIPDAPREKYIALSDQGKSLLEYPMSTVKIFNRNIPFGGGGYLRIFPNWFTKWAIKSVNKEGLPAILYMHPWEFDTDQPKVHMGALQNLRHYYNIKKNLQKLAELLDNFKWTSFKKAIENQSANLN